MVFIPPIPPSSFKGWQRIAHTQLSAPGTTISFTGLNGNTDLQYMLLLFYKNTDNVAQQSITIYFNNDQVVANYDRQRIISTGATVTGAFDNLPFIAAADALKWDSAWAFITTGGGLGVTQGIMLPILEASAALRFVFQGVRWNNGANLTSLDLVGSAAGIIATGSYFTLYRRR